MGMQEPYFLSLAREERDDLAFILRHRDLAFVQDHVLNIPPVLLDGVQHRQKGQQPERSRKDIRDWLRIEGGGTTQCETHSCQLPSERPTTRDPENRPKAVYLGPRVSAIAVIVDRSSIV